MTIHLAQKHLFLAVLGTVLVLVSTASANGDNRAKRFQVGTGVGFIMSPEGFNLGLEGEYYATKNISIAPKFAFSSVDGGELYMISAEGRFTLDLKGAMIEQNLKPWVGAGAGIVIADPDARFANTDTGIQFQAGAGLNYYFTNQMALGSNMEFIVPFGINDHFIYRWQMLQFKILL